MRSSHKLSDRYSNYIIQVQERALKVVPNLCETIDYAEVQGVIFPRVAVSVVLVDGYTCPNEMFQLVFTKTRFLSVKVTTLETFLAMVKTLDQVKAFFLLNSGRDLTAIP